MSVRVRDIYRVVAGRLFVSPRRFFSPAPGRAPPPGKRARLTRFFFSPRRVRPPLRTQARRSPAQRPHRQLRNAGSSRALRTRMTPQTHSILLPDRKKTAPLDRPEAPKNRSGPEITVQSQGTPGSPEENRRYWDTCQGKHSFFPRHSIGTSHSDLRFDRFVMKDLSSSIPAAVFRRLLAPPAPRSGAKSR